MQDFIILMLSRMLLLCGIRSHHGVVIVITNDYVAADLSIFSCLGRGHDLVDKTIANNISLIMGIILMGFGRLLVLQQLVLRHIICINLK